MGFEPSSATTLVAQLERCKQIFAVIEALHVVRASPPVEQIDTEPSTVPLEPLTTIAMDLQKSQAADRKDELILSKLPKIRNAALEKVLHSINSQQEGNLHESKHYY